MKEGLDYWKGRAERAEDYCQDYGNAIGTCKGGYWQHPNYICHHCNHDRSVDRDCPIAKKQETEMAKKTEVTKTTKSPKLKIIVEIKAVYTVDSLSEIGDIQESVDNACEQLQQYGSAQADTRFEVVD